MPVAGCSCFGLFALAHIQGCARRVRDVHRGLAAWSPLALFGAAAAEISGVSFCRFFGRVVTVFVDSEYDIAWFHVRFVCVVV